MIKSRFHLAVAATLIGALAVASCGRNGAETPKAQQASDAATSSRIFVNAEGVAINGYDPVSYFAGAPAPGQPTFAAVHEGATFRFASAENLAAFEADPAKYAPQYGGYCAYGAAKGAKFRTVAETGQVVDGKLYFNKNLDVKALWDKDQPGLIEEANSVWPTILDTDVKS